MRITSSEIPATHRLEAPETFFSILATAQATLQRRTRIVTPDFPSVPIGFVGYLGYEMKEVSMPPSKSSPAADQPERTDAEFAVTSRALSFSHTDETWYATGLVRLEGSTEEDLWVSKFGVEEDQWTTWLNEVEAFFAPDRIAGVASAPSGPVDVVGLKPDLARSEYMSAIERARQSIIAGDAYELCLTTQFRTAVSPTLSQDPYPLYLSLRASNPAPYSAYFRLPGSNIALLSSSPERFMRIDKDRQAEMKPIKGTVRRSDDPEEDQRRKEALAADEKERAENLMIVDLSRNDLLGFCEVESVQVPRLMVVESYQTVHQ